MDIASIARELYGAAPGDFIEIRKRLAKEARDAGGRELAAQVQAMRKPTVAGWFVNQLTRAHPDEISVLLELGREMRDGMAGLDGEELRLLTRRRHQLVAALVQQASALGQEQGVRLGPDAATGVRATLEATLSDPEAAELVEAGALTDALQVSGFGFGMTPSPPAGGTERRPAPVADLDAHRERKAGSIERAESDVEEAQTAVAEVRTRADKAERALEQADEARAEALVRVKRMEKKLRKARSSLDELGESTSTARDANRAAQLELRDAERKLVKLEKRLHDLQD